MTIEPAEISPEYAFNNYEISEEDLNSILRDVKVSFAKDPIYIEIEASQCNFSKKCKTSRKSTTHRTLVICHDE